MQFACQVKGLVFLVVLGARALSAFPLYTFRTFQVPGSLIGTTHPSDINASGQVAGVYYDVQESLMQGFVLNTDGRYDTFHVPIGFGETWAYGINASGVVAGTFYEQLGRDGRGFVRSSDGTTFASVSIPAAQMFVLGINDSGTLVGSLQNSGFDQGFTLTSDGVLTRFSVPGIAFTFVGGINNGGAVAGSFNDADGGRHGYLRSPDGGEFTIFDVPGYVGRTQAAGINNLGDIVGSAGTSGFLRNADGSFLLFDVPGALRTVAAGINDRGEIVGSYFSPGLAPNGWGGFLATPVPEPTYSGLSSLVVIGSLICRSIWWRRRS